MKSGFVVPYATEREFADLARLGEDRGWDAVLGWEALYGVEAWVQLGAAAMVTERIRLGTLLTPASRHRPWDLASRVDSVDRLSGGRAFMSVGLGALHPGWTAFEADEGCAVRARKLDECLARLCGAPRRPRDLHLRRGVLQRRAQRLHAAAAHPAASAPAGLGRWCPDRGQRSPALARARGPVAGPHPRHPPTGRAAQDDRGVRRRRRARAPSPAGCRSVVGGLRRRHRGGL